MFPATPIRPGREMATRMSAMPPDVGVAVLRATFSFDKAAALARVKRPIRAINSTSIRRPGREPALRTGNSKAAFVTGTGHFRCWRSRRSSTRPARRGDRGSGRLRPREDSHVKILVSGSNGLVGSALVPFLATGGHQVVRLVRARPGADRGAVFWIRRPESSTLRPWKGSRRSSTWPARALSRAAGTTPRRRASATAACGAPSFSPGRSPAWRVRRKCCCARRPSATTEIAATRPHGGERARPGPAVPCLQRLGGGVRTGARKGVRVVRHRFGMSSARTAGVSQDAAAVQARRRGRLGSGRQFISWIAVATSLGRDRARSRRHRALRPVNTVARSR